MMPNIPNMPGMPGANIPTAPVPPPAPQKPSWIIKKAGNKFQVIDELTGKVVATCATRKAALAQQRSLYANASPASQPPSSPVMMNPAQGQ